MSPQIDEVLIVDNNSTDGSGDIARRHGARVVSEPRQGYGPAYKTGLAHASGKIIGATDGDGSYHIEDIIRCATFLIKNNLNFVSGSGSSGGRYSAASPLRVTGWRSRRRSK